MACVRRALTASEFEEFVICVLILSLFCVFVSVVNTVYAVHVTIADEDERIGNNDLLDLFMADENINFINSTGPIDHQTKKPVINFTNFNYINLINVKFVYNDNGTILADIVISKDTDYAFSNGTTFGMAININDFPNPATPRLSDADYFYNYVYSNKAWYKSLSIRHTGGEENFLNKPQIAPASESFNENQHFFRMRFNTSNIGKPEEFQVQFFAFAEIKGPNNSTKSSYKVVDVTPWIELPPPQIFVSLNPNISKIYPGENGQVSEITLRSTSKVLNAVHFCQNDKCDPHLVNDCRKYCWIFKNNQTTIDPETNFASVPVSLHTNELLKGNMHLQMFYEIAPTGQGSTAPSKISTQSWNLDVGDRLSEEVQWITDLPNKFGYIIPLVTFIAGLFIDRKSLTLRIKNFGKKLKRKFRHKNQPKP